MHKFIHNLYTVVCKNTYLDPNAEVLVYKCTPVECLHCIPVAYLAAGFTYRSGDKFIIR